MKRLLSGQRSHWINSASVALAQGFSGLLGLITQLIAVRSVGIGDLTDGFFVVYVLPDAVAGVFFSLALLVVVPRMLEEGHLGSRGRALCWMFTWVSTGLLTICSGLTLVFAPSLATLLAPSLSEEGLRTAEVTLRIMAPLILLHGISGIATATLQAVHRFVIASLSKILFASVPFAAALIMLGDHGIHVIAWAALAGGALSTVYLLFANAVVVGLPSRQEFMRAGPEALQAGSGLLPVAIARTSTELWWLVIRAFATQIPGGATILVIAQRFSSALTLIGSSIASVAYPDIVREISAGTQALIQMTRKRCDQCLVCMSVVAWPMAGVAGELVWIMRHKGAPTGETAVDAGALCVGLFLLVVPWSTINGMLGNTTWALRFVWQRLALQIGTLIAIVPLLWLGVGFFGIIAVPCALLLEALALLVGGDLLLRRLVKRPVLDRIVLRQWAHLTLSGIFSMGVAWALSSLGRLWVGEHLWPRLVTMGLSVCIGAGVAVMFVYYSRKEAVRFTTPARSLTHVR